MFSENCFEQLNHKIDFNMCMGCYNIIEQKIVSHPGFPRKMFSPDHLYVMNHMSSLLYY